MVYEFKTSRCIGIYAHWHMNEYKSGNKNEAESDDSKPVYTVQREAPWMMVNR